MKIISLLWSLSAIDDPAALAPITITGKTDALSVQPIRAATVDIAPVMDHPNEVLGRIAGVWISRGSGQEHLTALRSPVLTGGGACGAFLYLENQLPIRPAGFCNVNNLFETFWEGAQYVEVLSGPGAVVHGANALHGVFNVEMPRAGEPSYFSIGGDSNGGQWTSGATDGERGRLQWHLAHEDGFRDQERADSQKVHYRYDGDRHESWLTAINLNQETAGFVLGEDAYRDARLRLTNPNPEAYRDAHAVRGGARLRWQRDTGGELNVTPFVRSSRMEFLQHFLPGQPIETNGQDSLGVQMGYRQSAWHVGFDVDIGQAFLTEIQPVPVTIPSAFLQAVRPAGLRYDYDVDMLSAGLFANWNRSFGSGWTVDAGVRINRVSYDYDNRASDGNQDPFGNPCGFGGCLANRPGDRSDEFVDLTPSFSLSRELGARGLVFGRIARGYRPPQVNELYRLQRGQDVADIDSESLDSVEVGYKWQGTVSGALSLFAMQKDNFIFNDADGFNVSSGRTEHHGVELAASGAYGACYWDANATWARHRYRQFASGNLSEDIVAGNDVDTAPRTMGRLSVGREFSFGTLSASWEHLGSYFLTGANEQTYPGHDLLNIGWQRNESWGSWQVEMANATNRRYAERADFAFGNFRYFPGQGRTVSIAIELKPTR